MVELCWGVLYLGVAAAINWAMGLYEKLGKEQVKWNWKQFIIGLIKIILIVGTIIGAGFIWEYSGIDVSGAGLQPITLTTSATLYYAYKAVKHLSQIIHVDKTEEADS